jgi:RNA polymerase sigma-70 factor (ECF subfamily)
MADIYKSIEAEIPRLRRYARALKRDFTAADDLVQDTLTRALAKLHLWQEGTNLRGWLVTVMHNQHVNQVRASIRAGAVIDPSEDGPPASWPANQDKCLELRDLDRALDRLPEEQRAVILLVGLEGMRYEEAAEALGIPTGTVRSRLSRGRIALRVLMDDTSNAAPRAPEIRARRRIAPPPLRENRVAASAATAVVMASSAAS